MKLDTKLIKETKELKNNVFIGSQLISFDDDETVAIVTILNEEMEELGDRSFGIDLNTFRLLKSLDECDIEYDDLSNQLIIKFGKNKKYKTKTIKQSIPALIESEFTGNIVIDGYKLQIAKSKNKKYKLKIEKLETKNNIKEIKKEKIQKEESGIKTKDIIKNLNTIRTLNEQN